MDRSIITLLGIVDVLEAVIQEQKPTKKFNPAKTLSSVQSLRRELQTEGLRHSQCLGKARDTVQSLMDQVTAASEGNRDLLWTLQGVRSAEIQEVQPPPLNRVVPRCIK